MGLRVEQLGEVPYQEAHELQLQLLEQLRAAPDREGVCLLLEHPSLFTLGRNGSAVHITVSEDFLASKGIEMIRVERGGQVTWHGPGQLVAYFIVNLRRNRLGVAAFVDRLEAIMLAVADRFAIQAGRDKRNHGIWCADRKLGSVGIAVRHGISFHGLALNVRPDLEPFSWINPCGMAGVQMTTMERELGERVSMDAVRQVMQDEVEEFFR
jgi:lipoate-protein ligase B